MSRSRPVCVQPAVIDIGHRPNPQEGPQPGPEDFRQADPGRALGGAGHFAEVVADHDATLPMVALTISPRDTRPRRRPAGSVTATRLMPFAGEQGGDVPHRGVRGHGNGRGVHDVPGQGALDGQGHAAFGHQAACHQAHEVPGFCDAHAGEEILFRNDPHHLMLGVDHGHPGHPPPAHGRGHLGHRRVGLDRHHVGGHDLGGGDGPAQALQGVLKRQAVDLFKVARGDIQVPGDGPHGLQDILLFDLYPGGGSTLRFVGSIRHKHRTPC